MKTLSDYTDEELRKELRRRAQEKRKNQKHEITYIEFEATICEVYNTYGYKCGGKIIYLPFSDWNYRIKDCSLEFANHFPWSNYFNKRGCFKRDNAPQMGDRVKLRYRRTKGDEVFDLQKAKIIEIIKEK